MPHFTLFFFLFSPLLRVAFRYFLIFLRLNTEGVYVFENVCTLSCFLITVSLAVQGGRCHLPKLTMAECNLTFRLSGGIKGGEGSRNGSALLESWMSSNGGGGGVRLSDKEALLGC